MVLIAFPHHLDAMRRHAERSYPEECCGLLIGRLEGDRRLLLETLPAENAWNQPDAPEVFAAPDDTSGITKERRYTIAPQFLLKVQKAVRDRNLAILGIYHSHPDHEAVPSAFDLEYAWAEYSYIIVSVQQGTAQDLRNWRLDDRHQFEPEEIAIVAETPLGD